MRTLYMILAACLLITAGPAIAAPEGGAPAADAQNEENGRSEERKLPDLKPGTWEPVFEVGESIYPSLAISTATLKGGLWDEGDQQHLGDRWGLIGAAVRGTEDESTVAVEISGEDFIKPSAFVGKLPKKDTVYCVYPDLKYDYEKLLKVKQTVPEILTFKVRIGNKAYPVRTARVQVRTVNECVYYFADSSGGVNKIPYFYAAYVNENHPFINQILKEAIQSGRAESFDGYAGDGSDKESILPEIKAIWGALQDRGIRYSAMPASQDDDDPDVGSQYVRLLGESINYAQANCVDGSVLMASIFRKIGLDAMLVSVPEHMFVGVALDREGKDIAYIETTDLGQTTFEEALQDGGEAYEKGGDKFESEKEDDQEYSVINIQDARRMGIMPIKDSAAEKIAEKGSHPTRAEEAAEDGTDR